MSWKKKLEFLKYLDPDYYADLLIRKVHAPNEKSFTYFLVDNAIILGVYLVSAFLLYSFLGLLLQTSDPLVVVVSGSMEPLLFRGDVGIVQGVTSSALLASEVTLNESVAGKPLREFASLNKGEPNQECQQLLRDRAERDLERFGLSNRAPNEELINDYCSRIESITFNEGNETIPVNVEGDVVVYSSAFSGKQIIHRAIAKINTPQGTYLLTKGDNEDTNPTIDQDCSIVNGEFVNCIHPYPIPLSDVSGKLLFKIPLVGYVKLLVFGA